MSREYVSKEVEAIYKDKSFVEPLNLAMAAAWIMGNYKGLNLKVLDLTNHSSIADFFVIGSAGNPTQARAMAEEISLQMFEKDLLLITQVNIHTFFRLLA